MNIKTTSNRCDSNKKERFRTYNDTVNLEKLKFFLPEVKFLGHIILTNNYEYTRESSHEISASKEHKKSPDLSRVLDFLP